MSQLPAGCIVRYRICTEKSVLGFGKFGDLRVGDIMKVDEEYIPWIYYNKAGISFHADILAHYGLDPVEKPGTAPEKFYEWKRKRSEGFTEDQRMHGAAIKARAKKAQAVARLIRVRKATQFSKGELQAINHGHKKG